MKSLQLSLGLILAIGLANPAPSQRIFGKKTKANPSQRVPELIISLKTETSDRKRILAAEELREYDSQKFTEIVPVLADVLAHDKKTNVRAEALTSLARIRPVNTLAGQAIEKAAGSDESWRIRLQARAALTRYYLAGYSKKANTPVAAKKDKTTPTTDEPPTGPAPPVPASPLPAPRIGEPRVAEPQVPRPLPPGVAPAPKAKSSEAGPSLFP